MKDSLLCIVYYALYTIVCIVINLILIPWLLVCLILKKKFPISPLS